MGWFVIIDDYIHWCVVHGAALARWQLWVNLLHGQQMRMIFR
jgi:hypothetical protein